MLGIFVSFCWIATSFSCWRCFFFNKKNNNMKFNFELWCRYLHMNPVFYRRFVGWSDIHICHDKYCIEKDVIQNLANFCVSLCNFITLNKRCFQILKFVFAFNFTFFFDNNGPKQVPIFFCFDIYFSCLKYLNILPYFLTKSSLMTFFV